MAKIQVTVSKVSAHPAAGVVFDHTTVTVKDSAGQIFSADLNGKEVPAWSSNFTVAEGVGVVTVADFDSTGNQIGSSPAPVNFDTTQGSYPASSSAVVTVLPG